MEDFSFVSASLRRGVGPSLVLLAGLLASAPAIAQTGNVGIGTSSPGQKLEVAGQVFSSTGGFRFPDNTVQTTAAVTATGTNFI